MKKSMISEILMYLCVLLLGVSLIIWADKVTSAVSIMLGILTVLYALVIFVNYFRNKERGLSDNLQLVVAIVIALLGFVLIFRVDFLKELISFVIGIYIILSSIIKLSDAINIYKRTNLNNKGAIITSVILIIIGLMCIVGKFIIADMMVKFLGFMLVLYSIISIINLIFLNKNR